MSFRLLTGDVLEQLRPLPDESVQLAAMSPPYWKQRVYDGARPTIWADGSASILGDERCPEEFADHMVEILREVRRVLRSDGLCFVNLGTNYVGGNSRAVDSWKEQDAVPNAWLVGLAARADGWWLRSEVIWEKLNPKPSSVQNRFCLVHETVLMLSKTTTYFSDMDAVREPYAAASIARSKYPGWDVGKRHSVHQPGKDGPVKDERGSYAPNPQGRIRKSVWRTNAPSFEDGHTASFPEELVEPMVMFGTSEAGACSICRKPLERVVELGPPLTDIQLASGGTKKSGGSLAGGHRPGRSRESYEKQKAEDPMKVKQRVLDSMRERITTGWRRACACDSSLPTVPCVVLDPFVGTGTTLAVALRLGREGIGIDTSSHYIEDLARPRLAAIASQGLLRFNHEAT